MKAYRGNDINDGMERFDHGPHIFALLDTPEVQRMGYVTQNGFAKTSFPNLSHARKAHLIGTAKYAAKIYRAIQRNGPAADAALPEYEPAVTSAGLLHDIGHSAFSHHMDSVLRGARGKGHEEVAADLILGNTSLAHFYKNLPHGLVMSKAHQDALVREVERMPTLPQVLRASGVAPEMVAAIVCKETDRDGNILGRNKFLREIVDGKVFDGDKFDYLERDPSNAGISESRYEPESLISRLGLVEVNGDYHIAVADTGLPILEQMMVTRKYMYSVVYTHKTVLRVNAMMREAFKRLVMSQSKKRLKGMDLTSALPLLDEAQIEALMANACEDPVASMLFFRAKYNRPELYRRVYTIDAHRTPTFLGQNRGDGRLIRRIYEKLDEAKEQGYDYPEDFIRDQIIERANNKEVEPHDVIAFFPEVKRRFKNQDDAKEAFDFYVFDHRHPDNPRQVRAAKELLGKDERVDTLFRVFCDADASSYFLVLAAPEHADAIQKATENYMKELRRT